jgi:hypothetical protein
MCVFCTVFIGAAILAWKSCIKLFDVYFFRHKGKNILFYQNKKYTIYYKNQNKTICINNKTRVEKHYSADDFMNLKFGFHRMTDEMKVKENKHGYRINAKLDKRRLSQSCPETTLWLDKDLYPQKILEGVYIHEFMGDLQGTIKIPKELLNICDERNIARPPDNDKIEYI